MTIDANVSHARGAIAPPRRRPAFRINSYVFFILPGVLMVLALTLFPALYGIYISLTNLNLGYLSSSFVGFANYGRFFTSPELATVARNTAGFVGSVVLLQAVFGLLIALVLNERLIGRELMRSIAILPWVLPSVVVALVFAQIFGGSKLGIVNYLLSLVGIGQQAWFSDPLLAMSILVAVAVWRGVPFTIIVLLGGLQTLPHDVYEAALIDGANRWQRFRYITLPIMRPLIMITLILGTGGALNSLDIPLALTGGGPGRATELISITLYQQSFFYLDISYGATIGTIMLIANVALIVLYLLVLQPRKGAGND